MNPLDHITVLLTRSRARMAETAAILEQEGIDVRCAAVTEIRSPETWTDMDRALEAVGSYDAIVCTSANGMDTLVDRARSRAPRVRDGISAIPMYVVGASSADRGAAHGLRTVLLPGVVDASSLATAMTKALPSGTRVLHVQGDLADRTLGATLNGHGIVVEDVIAYRTVQVSSDERERIGRECRATDIDAVVFFSPSAVDGLVACTGDAWIKDRSVIALGKRTTARLTSLGIEVAFAPTTPSVHEIMAFLRAPGFVPKRKGISY